MADKRRAERAALKVLYRATDAEGMAELHFESSDLSPGGTFLRSDVLLDVGEALLLELALPARPEPIRAQAKVAWVRRFPKDGEPAGMGMQFLSMTESDRTALVAYLQGK